MKITKVNILLYVVAFLATTVLLALFGYAGYLYVLLIGSLGLIWLWKGLQGFKTKDDKLWARNMFLFSLVVIMAVCIAISIESLVL